MAKLLLEIHRRYEGIIHSNTSEIEKDKSFASLMTCMERKFAIPVLRSEAWEKKNKAIIALYRVVSESRSTL